MGCGGCSARPIRWSSWANRSKPTSEAVLEEWIGRRDIICDAGVTRRLMLNGRADTHLTVAFCLSSIYVIGTRIGAKRRPRRLSLWGGCAAGGAFDDSLEL
jgi:hypothetical protein